MTDIRVETPEEPDFDALEKRYVELEASAVALQRWTVLNLILSLVAIGMGFISLAYRT